MRGARGVRFAVVVALVAALTSLAPVACRAPAGGGAGAAVRVGSKVFTESVILGEIVTGLLRQRGTPAEHRRQLGGTQILYRALVAGEIDVYPEYTGTLIQEILRGGAARAITTAGDGGDGGEALAAVLAARGVRMTGRLGFNNTYAIGMKTDRAAALGIARISDLAAHPELRLAFSNEFLARRPTRAASTMTSPIAAWRAATSTSPISTPPIPRSPSTACASSRTIGASSPNTRSCCCIAPRWSSARQRPSARCTRSSIASRRRA